MFTIFLRKPFLVPIFLSTNSIEPQCARQQTAAAAAAVRREAAAPGATTQLDEPELLDILIQFFCHFPFLIFVLV